MPSLSRRFLDKARFDWLLTALATVLTLLYLAGIRKILHVSNQDDEEYIRWYRAILQLGRWHSLSGSFSSYNPPYLYVLTAFSYLDGLIRPLYLIKLLTVPFLLASALLAYSICRVAGCSGRRSLLAFWIFLVAPEIIANSLVWGQTDILETTFVLLFVRLALARRPGWAMAAAGVALSFKLQTIFIGPAVLALLLAGELPWWSLLAVPVAYEAMLVPAELAGRSLRALTGAYSTQTAVAERISMGAPNPYRLLMPFTGFAWEGPTVLWIERFGIFLAAVASVLFLRFVLRVRPSLQTGSVLQTRGLLLVLALSGVMEPFLLPKMHERYFFIGNTLALVLGVIVPRMLVPAVLLQVAAVAAYAPYLLGFKPTTWYFLPLVLMVAGAIVLLGLELGRGVKQDWAGRDLRAHSGPGSQSV